MKTKLLYFRLLYLPPFTEPNIVLDTLALLVSAAVAAPTTSGAGSNKQHLLLKISIKQHLNIKSLIGTPC